MLLKNNRQALPALGLRERGRPAPARPRQVEPAVLFAPLLKMACRWPASSSRWGRRTEAAFTDLHPSFTSSFFPAHFRDWKLEALFSYTQNCSLTHTFFPLFFEMAIAARRGFLGNTCFPGQNSQRVHLKGSQLVSRGS